MSIVSHRHPFVVGVDTHARNHVYAIFDASNGALVDTQSFPTTAAGINRAVKWVARRTNTGATAKVSAPVCTDCHKPLRAMHYKGDNWYCGVCGPTPEPCTGCGILSRVASLTSDGGPLCNRCPVSDGTAPIGIIMQIVAAINPGIGTEIVRTAILAAAPQSGQRLRLVRALQDQPGLLTGDGA